jgi:hypothetical protein
MKHHPNATEEEMDENLVSILNYHYSVSTILKTSDTVF